MNFDYSHKISIGAEGNKAKYYGKNKICYVEGEDDIIFWEKIFLKNSNLNIYFEEVSGLKNLKEKTKTILSGGDILLAMDSDYLGVFDKKIKHNNIIYTYHHSIENQIYCPIAIAEYIRSGNRMGKPEFFNLLKLVIKKIKDIEKNINELLFYELLNEINILENKTDYSGISVLGENSYHFLKKGKLEVLKSQIDKKISKVENLFTTEEKERIEQILKNKQTKPKYKTRGIVRGHFLTGIVIRIIQKISNEIDGKNLACSDNILFTCLLNECIQCTCKCRQTNYYKEKFQHIK